MLNKRVEDFKREVERKVNDIDAMGISEEALNALNNLIYSLQSLAGNFDINNEETVQIERNRLYEMKSDLCGKIASEERLKEGFPAQLDRSNTPKALQNKVKQRIEDTKKTLSEEDLSLVVKKYAEIYQTLNKRERSYYDKRDSKFWKDFGEILPKEAVDRIFNRDNE